MRKFFVLALAPVLALTMAAGVAKGNPAVTKKPSLVTYVFEDERGKATAAEGR